MNIIYILLSVISILFVLDKSTNNTVNDDNKNEHKTIDELKIKVKERTLLDSLKQYLLHKNNSDPHLDLGLTNSLADDGPKRPAELSIPINIETQGPIPNYDQVGYVFNEDSNTRLPLYGRKKHHSSQQYEYYVQEDSRNRIKIPIDTERDMELYDEDKINITGYEGEFDVNIYDREKLRYIPYVY